VAEAARDREGWVLKPCQYGGGHGVILGQDTAAQEWTRQLEEHWSDPSWALQRFYVPRKTPSGEWTSFGVYVYGGKLGGVAIRTAPTSLISVRSSRLIPAVAAG
jgi:hypothetical protein